jgi:hypothetical protein
MAKKEIPGGVVHDLPSDVHKALTSDAKALAAWEDITPLARNEWICWITIVKKPETRQEHIERMIAQLNEGKRRPCCWPGCPHRRPNAKKWFERGRSASQPSDAKRMLETHRQIASS